MAPTLEQLGIDQLSIPDQIELVQAIWQSIAAQNRARQAVDESTGFIVADWHKRILDERIAEYEADPSIGIPWEVAKAQLMSRK